MRCKCDVEEGRALHAEFYTQNATRTALSKAVLLRAALLRAALRRGASRETLMKFIILGSEPGHCQSIHLGKT